MIETPLSKNQPTVLKNRIAGPPPIHLTWDGAVEPGLEVGGPVLVEDVLAPRVPLAHPGHPRVHGLAAVHVLDGHLAKEEVHVLAHLEEEEEDEEEGEGERRMDGNEVFQNVV